MIFSVAVYSNIVAQISPGDLTSAHANLEGISNCTKCHVIGSKVRSAECLACHTEIQKLQNEKKGYHSTQGVINQNCIVCHNEHHGRNFRIINFDAKNFDHSKITFPLTGKHTKIDCYECHKHEFISDEKSIKRKGTFLGLHNSCNSCHQDIHRGTLGRECDTCHSTENFKSAPKFNHQSAKFVLAGAHLKIDCIKCHPIETKDNKNYQHFKDISFNSCSSCHQDYHKGKFGSKCESCHVTESFKTIKNLEKFDHSKTNYPLVGKHLNVKCLDCHKGGLNAKPKYDKCISCHSDYHNGEFVKNIFTADCNNCHNVNGFNFTSYTIEDHNKAKFSLIGSHLAIPCQNCHRKEDKWKFKIDGSHCTDCHVNVHKDSIPQKIMKSDNCEVCHNSERWNEVSFNHKETKFELLGVHSKQNCIKCHIRNKDIQGTEIIFTQKSECVNCHKDVHFGQFKKNGIVLCENCHLFDNWKNNLFDHSKTSFLLEGAHSKVPCDKCHKTVTDEIGKYVKYKFDEVKCVLCHSS